MAERLERITKFWRPGINRRTRPFCGAHWIPGERTKLEFTCARSIHRCLGIPPTESLIHSILGALCYTPQKYRLFILPRVNVSSFCRNLQTTLWGQLRCLGDQVRGLDNFWYGFRSETLDFGVICWQFVMVAGAGRCRALGCHCGCEFRDDPSLPFGVVYLIDRACNRYGTSQ